MGEVMMFNTCLKCAPLNVWTCSCYNKQLDNIDNHKSLTTQINEMREDLERIRKHLPSISARPNTKTELGDDIKYADLVLAKYPKSVEADDEL